MKPQTCDVTDMYTKLSDLHAGFASKRFCPRGSIFTDRPFFRIWPRCTRVRPHVDLLIGLILPTKLITSQSMSLVWSLCNFIQLIGCAYITACMSSCTTAYASAYYKSRCATFVMGRIEKWVGDWLQHRSFCMLLEYFGGWLQKTSSWGAGYDSSHFEGMGR